MTKPLSTVNIQFFDPLINDWVNAPLPGKYSTLLQAAQLVYVSKRIPEYAAHHYFLKRADGVRMYSYSDLLKRLALS